jgi:hypothetical protein
MAALAGEELREFGRDLAGVSQKGVGKADRFLRSCRGRGAVFRLDRRHEKETRRGMLRVSFYAQAGEKRVVEIESSARGAVDGGWQNNAGGTEGVPLGRRCEVAPPPAAMPKALEDKFRKERAAWANYEKFPPGYRRMTAGWVASAKKQETQMKRFQKLIEFSAQNERIEFM